MSLCVPEGSSKGTGPDPHSIRSRSGRAAAPQEEEEQLLLGTFRMEPSKRRSGLGELLCLFVAWSLQAGG